MKIWTAADNALILALHAEGKTRAEIAERLGVTRNAICGKLHRMIGPKNDGRSTDEAAHGAPDSTDGAEVRAPEGADAGGIAEAETIETQEASPPSDGVAEGEPARASDIDAEVAGDAGAQCGLSVEGEPVEPSHVDTINDATRRWLSVTFTDGLNPKIGDWIGLFGRMISTYGTLIEIRSDGLARVEWDYDRCWWHQPLPLCPYRDLRTHGERKGAAKWKPTPRSPDEHRI